MTTATTPSTARDVMTREVRTVRDDTTLSELSDLLRREEISGVPVVDEDGRLVGVVSATDLLASVAENRSAGPAERPDYFRRAWEDSYDEEDLVGVEIRDEGPMVRDIMNPATYTVEEGTTLPEIARLMLQAHVHRVLVLEGSELVGIVSSSDLLKVLASEV